MSKFELKIQTLNENFQNVSLEQQPTNVYFYLSN